ncbi:MAG TPA: helix-turn-helix domain-containing protein [Bacteroidota bacterium]|nr:helix-turn-helix domain-containing protein [Bacteroidota bacterium]
MTADYLLRRAQSLIIKQRLQWMKEYETTNNANSVCRRFGISRKTFYKWHKRYEESNRDESSLIDLPRTPHSNKLRTSNEVREQVLKLREETGYGPRKIEDCLRKDDIRISSGTIWKIISRFEKEQAFKQSA